MGRLRGGSESDLLEICARKGRERDRMRELLTLNLCVRSFKFAGSALKHLITMSNCILLLADDLE